MTEREDTRTTPSRGQIGLAVLAVALCGATGVAWLSGGSPDESTLAFGPSSTSTVPAAEQERQARNETTISPAAVTAAPEEDDVPFQAAQVQQTEFGVIVRFDGEPVLEEIGKSFRKDPDGARARFGEWASGKPALQGLRLESASYSGELVLSGRGPRSMRDTISAIEAMDNVAYVEPDYSAKPSKEG